MSTQTCPRRMDVGPWQRDPDLDSWETDRWTKDRAAVEAKQKAEDEARPSGNIHRGPHNDLWIDESDVPRTCSFCGGIHPDDAIALVKSGWEVEATGKNYKRYLHPKGYGKNCEAVIARIKNTELPWPEFWNPVPPVKLYTMHFNQEQIDAFNAAIKANKESTQ